eukprot:g7946.t1
MVSIHLEPLQESYAILLSHQKPVLQIWPWEDSTLDEMDQAKRRVEANFEFLKKLGIEYWCFHDRDIAPEGKTLNETNAKLDEIVELILTLQKDSGIRLLWGTAQLFKHPRYMHGAATSPDPEVFAFAASQAKKALEVSQRLGALGFNTWGGREGYNTLRNTNMKLELNNYAKFLKMLVDYKKEIEFNHPLLIEPKPQEPTKHQYDFDAAATFAFLLKNGLEKEFKIVVECNHATLAGHTCEHELLYSSIHGMLGSVDINTGDPQIGWDTDQFLTDITEATLIMAIIIKQGGIAPGGFNFDAKLRRESIDVKDLFYAHIGSMDALARGLRNAARMIEEGKYEQEIQNRYKAYFNTELGRDIMDQKVGFKELEQYTLSHEDPVGSLKSAQAEKFESMLSEYIN